MHENYVAMATAGRVNDAQRRVFFAAGERLCRDQGAEVVLLGGTDLFLAFQGRDAGFPVLDCADVHVEAIYRRRCGQREARRTSNKVARSICQAGRTAGLRL